MDELIDTLHHTEWQCGIITVQQPYLRALIQTIKNLPDCQILSLTGEKQAQGFRQFTICIRWCIERYGTKPTFLRASRHHLPKSTKSTIRKRRRWSCKIVCGAGELLRQHLSCHIKPCLTDEFLGIKTKRSFCYYKPSEKTLILNSLYRKSHLRKKSSINISLY